MIGYMYDRLYVYYASLNFQIRVERTFLYNY